MPSFGQSLQGKRVAMLAHKRALRQALTLLPSETHMHKLAEVDAMVDALPDYHAAKLAWADVIQFQRMNPDVLGLAVPFGFDDAQIDALFAVAMALEAGATEAEALAVL